jgi:hypothetical protein
MPMRLCLSIFLLTAVCGAASVAHGQGDQPAAPAPAQGVKSPSATLQPALSNLRTALDGVRLDKWKASGPVRDEVDSNMGSIRRDLDNTLPGLLTTADGAPNSTTRILPAYRNVEALYDVALRIDAAARMFAPAPTVSALDQALAKLDEARRDLGDRLQSAGLAQEKQVSDLQASLKAAPTVAPAAPAPVCAPAPAPTKKKPAAKPAAKPATKPATAPPS